MNRNVRGITIQFWQGQVEIIQSAAEKAGMSVPDYFRGPLLAFAAQDAAIPLPSFPPFRKRGTDRRVAQVAKLLDVDPRDFVADVARRTATLIAEAMKPPLAKTRSNGRMKASAGADGGH